MNNNNIDDRILVKVLLICIGALIQFGGSVPSFFNLQLFNQHLMSQKDIRLDLLRKIELNPEYTQRELSKEMGVSLGKVNYCMKKLTEKGWVKFTNFSHNPNKISYVYLLTPSGIEEKSRLTISFLKKKIVEYEILKKEINELKLESEEVAYEKQ